MDLKDFNSEQTLLEKDETYVKVKGVWMYLYRAVDSQENTLEFHLSAARDAQAAKHFFGKALNASHTETPRVITVDKNAAYPKALNEMKTTGAVPVSCVLRQSKYLNNLIEQDQCFVKRSVKAGLGFRSLSSSGYLERWSRAHLSCLCRRPLTCPSTGTLPGRHRNDLEHQPDPGTAARHHHPSLKFYPVLAAV